MIRQAHTYFVGAMSGTALIAAAVVTFVVLVSLQALRDWPLAGIGGTGDSAAVSTGQPASGTGNAASAAAGGRAAGAVGNGANGTSRRHRGVNSLGDQRGATTAGGTDTFPAPSAGESPPSSSAAGAGSTSSSPSGGGNGGGSGGGGGTGGGSEQSTSGAVTGTANETVSGVDQATGGTLGSTGVTKATEETVNDVAGPESPVGKTVDKAVETAGGMLGVGK